MKVWLIHTMAPFYGTDQYYKAYAKEETTLEDWLYENWFDQECQNLWDSYSFRLNDSWDEEWEEMSDEDKEEFYENDFDTFIDVKYQEWCDDCSMDINESTEDECLMYVPGGEGDLEIVYDERNEE